MFQPYFAQFDITARQMGIASAIGALLAVGLQKNICKLEQMLGRKAAFTLSALPSWGWLHTDGSGTQLLYGIYCPLAYLCCCRNAKPLAFQLSKRSYPR